MFGEFVKERRIARDITLRKFCQAIEWDASNWSKIERGLSLRPGRGGAEVIGIERGSEEWQAMTDLAASGRKCSPMTSQRTEES